MKNGFLKHLLLYVCVFIALGWSWEILRPQYAPGSAMDVWVLNVGQGESVLVRDPSGKKILFDGGPDDSVLTELGSVLPVWDKHIDLVILSHNHSDHIRGLISVMERYQVDEVWVSGAVYSTADYRAWIEQLTKKHLVAKHMHAFEQEELGKLSLTVEHPLTDMTGAALNDQHDATVSVKISYGSEDLFLTGDLNEQHEADMIKACQPPSCSLQAEVLQVPHHGSATGLSSGFLHAVSPQIAVIPVGLNNKFHHPRQNILDELHSAHIPTYRTDLNGRIHLVITPLTISVQTARAAPQ